MYVKSCSVSGAVIAFRKGRIARTDALNPFGRLWEPFKAMPNSRNLQQEGNIFSTPWFAQWISCKTELLTR